MLPAKSTNSVLSAGTSSTLVCDYCIRHEKAIKKLIMILGCLGKSLSNTSKCAGAPVICEDIAAVTGMHELMDIMGYEKI